MERISIINKLQFIPSSDIPALWITASSPSAGKELKWPWARYLAFGRGLSMLCKRNGKNTGHLRNLKDDEQFCKVHLTLSIIVWNKKVKTKISKTKISFLFQVSVKPLASQSYNVYFCLLVIELIFEPKWMSFGCCVLLAKRKCAMFLSCISIAAKMTNLGWLI